MCHGDCGLPRSDDSDAPVRRRQVRECVLDETRRIDRTYPRLRDLQEVGSEYVDWDGQ
jgi:hypothetical protein